MYAAVFDLDGAMLAASSVATFRQSLAAVGVDVTTPSRSLGQSRFGLHAGDRVGAVQAAGLLAADALADRMLPRARAEIDRHRREGAALVLATSSPQDLVQPLASSWGFDELIGTRYRSAGGVYDSTIEGEYVAGRAKAETIATWAGRNAITLTNSWAYSNLWSDLALLELVGNPVAVNPDVRLLAVAAYRRWAIRDFGRPAGVLRFAGEAQRLILPFLEPRLCVMADLSFGNVAPLVAPGPVIVATSHTGPFDYIALGYLASRCRRPLRVVVDKPQLGSPLIDTLLEPLGAIMVDADAPVAERLLEVEAALDGGHAVVVFGPPPVPGAAGPDPAWGVDLTSSGYADAIRLSQRTSTPIVPLGIVGSERAWSPHHRLPRVPVIGERPPVHFAIGKPFTVGNHTRLTPATIRLATRIAGLAADAPVVDVLAAGGPPTGARR